MITYSNLKTFKIGSTWQWLISVKWVFGPMLRKIEVICNEKKPDVIGNNRLDIQIQREK